MHIYAYVCIYIRSAENAEKRDGMQERGQNRRECENEMHNDKVVNQI